jgi:hypothetical protein
VRVDQQHAPVDALDLGIGDGMGLGEANAEKDRKKAKRSHALNNSAT